MQPAKPTFESYKRDPKLYDEIFDETDQVREIYNTLFDLYSEHSAADFNRLNNKAKSSFF